MSFHLSPGWTTSTRTLTAVCSSLALTVGALASYVSHVEPRWTEVVHLALPLARLPQSLDGLTLAQISDLHAGHAFGTGRIRRCVSMVNALHPDIIVTTGDMFHRGPEWAAVCAHELGALRAPLGVYAIMGNHERRLPPDEGEAPFRRAGLTVLCNASHQVRVNGASLWMLGMDDLLTGHGNLSDTLQGVPAEACKVLLVHEPDFADYAARYPIDLQLSGHTHGGQVRLPGIGPLMLPLLGHKYPVGLYRIPRSGQGDMWVYTNRGLGLGRPPVRLNCRPEITLFTLRSTASQRQDV